MRGLPAVHRLLDEPRIARFVALLGAPTVKRHIGAVLDEARAGQIDSEARAEADLAADFAEASPFPTIEDITKDVYWEEDNPSEKKSSGRIFFE